MSSVRPTGAVPGGKVFQLAPVVEVRATAGEAAVTGKARMTEGSGEAAAMASAGESLG